MESKNLYSLIKKAPRNIEAEKMKLISLTATIVKQNFVIKLEAIVCIARHKQHSWHFETFDDSV